MLRNLLDKFWQWSTINFDDYNSGHHPNFAMEAEWEVGFPKFEQLRTAFETACHEYYLTYSEVTLHDLHEAIAIDNATGNFFNYFWDNHFNTHTLVKSSLKSEAFWVRVQLVWMVRDKNYTYKMEVLRKLVKDEHPIVRQQAKGVYEYLSENSN